MAKLLVADDHRDSADVLAELLRVHGHSVQVVYSGQDCLKAFDDFNPDAVLVDFWMPGVSGAEVARQLRNRVPVVAITGDQSLGEDARLFACHVTKPVDIPTLARLLAIIDKRP